MIVKNTQDGSISFRELPDGTDISGTSLEDVSLDSQAIAIVEGQKAHKNRNTKKLCFAKLVNYLKDRLDAVDYESILKDIAEGKRYDYVYSTGSLLQDYLSASPLLDADEKTDSLNILS